ncbi:bifunctional aminotransferase class I/II-fold pyridoxal phosphate-dependent enzyme/GNAT family N-acetyltransferase [Microscilla marina]|uniref:Aminotransferase, classes I and II family n=1 Tax=Microscilla marina ATCC 23134 TaxID=313606 RepID=A1ZH29_MICM2|nr:bifunctional aminotransferase class I/II-fold pyridoxal phosphate-dependent enzyme/GNAT family N-acetyltransferase [Microscilla marina]EAY30298.1 aminotransferase, classes I and II family [Microscilla marina ATCC 23134]
MSKALDTLNQILVYGANKGVTLNSTTDKSLSGTQITIKDQSLINFGSCSYMGLEYHNALKAGAQDALERYGTQFSTSRTYLSLGLYDELEAELHNIFQKPLIATASTTLGHLAALPVIIEEGDAVILDLQVHSSVQMATQILKARKVPIYIIPHNSTEGLEMKIKQLQNKHKKIWYLADGVYSMYGDGAPLKELERMLNTYKQFHLYIDDAHGMGWTGENGVGYVRSKMAHHDKMVLATSLNKSFASAGGLIVFPNEEMRNKVRNCGSTLIFSGPIQPPMLGAAIASAKLHQTSTFEQSQKELQAKIAYTNQRIEELNLPQYCPSETPLFFICAGTTRIICNIIDRMKQRGFYLNSAGFPAVPMKKGGIRFMITAHHTYQEIDAMLVALQREYVLGLEEEGSSIAHVAKTFKLPPFEIVFEEQVTEKESKEDDTLQLHEELYRTIESIDSKEWDKYLGTDDGCHSYNNIRQLQMSFSNHPRKEDNAQFYFHKVTDERGEIVTLAFFTSAWVKDDMFADAEVSAKVEEMRMVDPYYLTSKQVVTGTMFSMGKSVYMNRQHPQWKQGLEKLIEQIQQVVEQEGASKLILRDFDQTESEDLKDMMLELGLIAYQLPNNCVVEHVNWNSQEEYLQTLSSKYRYSLRKEILKYTDQFDVRFDKPTTEPEKRTCFELYKNVFDKALEMNVFELPYAVFEMMYNDPNYDIIRLYLKGSDEVVGVLFSYRNGSRYNALAVGLNYEYVRTHNTYKQILYQSVLRANALGCITLDLAFTAELEKKKVGATVKPVYAFVQAAEHLSHAILETIQ